MNVLPRIILAGLSGGSGKTIVSLGLCRALANQGLTVRPFKKGPDYIDASWLGLAARVDCTNLDPFLLSRKVLTALFVDKALDFDIAIIEGNRGLFDGKDVIGSSSTAELARWLNCPLVLVLDCAKMTRTAAAVVAGCRFFESDLRLVGVILNRTSGERHRKILREVIEAYTDVPVMGMIPKLTKNPIPERHMGLISDQEYARRDEALDFMARIAFDCLDLENLLNSARRSPVLARPDIHLWPETITGESPIIGYVRDMALWFYYPENLEALERAGARLVRLSLLDPAPWPEVHGLYLGGGFPETQAEALSANKAVRIRVCSLAKAGLPIYAECGGFMYLCRSLEQEGRSFPMAGVLPLKTMLCFRPQGLGYVEALVELDNPFHPKGRVIRGHEFHYSSCMSLDDHVSTNLALCMERGKGIYKGRDGLIVGNVWAGYIHIHALGELHWAKQFVVAAAYFRNGLAST